MPEPGQPSRLSTEDLSAIVFPTSSRRSSASAAGAPRRELGATDGADHLCVIVDAGNAHKGHLPRIRVRGKEYQTCWRSLFVFPVNGAFRQRVLSFVEWKWFETFILVLIALNSAFLASYQYREPPDQGFNAFVNEVAEVIFLAFFTLELVLKVIAWGFFLDRKSYLRDAWNWLDFIVVVSAWIQLIWKSGGLSFLRLFRILRPLRSLNAVPQMKVLVNTVISSVPRLSYVSGVAAALFVIFGIIGTTLMDGIFYRGCRATENPVLITVNGSSCWSWPYVEICDGGSCETDRLCGGTYMCEHSSGFCGGREDDQNWQLRPVFSTSAAPRVDEDAPYEHGCAPGLPDGELCTYRGGSPWCADSVPRKQYPETDFVHFDHMGGALLTLFQCMTMEGWTEIMYYAQDGYGYWVGTAYFFSFNAIASVFLLNIALAVVDEARESFEEDEEEEEEAPGAGQSSTAGGLGKEAALDAASGGLVAREGTGGEDANSDEEAWVDLPVWHDHPVVTFLRMVAMNEVFNNTIMFFIAGNVVVMALDQYPPALELEFFIYVSEWVFLGVFVIEMLIMIGALGPKGYVTNPVTCFDGIIVLTSVLQAALPDAGGGFVALRTLRLLRVMNKLAHRWPSFKVLLKAMVQTGISLNYWLVLFILVLYICTLMWMEFFSKQFHFVDPEAFDAAADSQGLAWCNGIVGSLADLSEAQRRVAMSCIPRANFDTFQWSFVTIFQIMTGENWNTVMYAGVRSKWNQRGTFYFLPEMMALLFVLLIFFGQILFLSLFLSMLISKFDKVQDELEDIEIEKARLEKLRLLSLSRRSSGVPARGVWGAVSNWVAKDERGNERNEPQAMAAVVPGEALDSAAPPPKRRAGRPQEKDSVGMLPGQPDLQLDDVGDPAALPNRGGTQPAPVQASKPWQVGGGGEVVDVPEKDHERRAYETSRSIETVPTGPRKSEAAVLDTAVLEVETLSRSSNADSASPKSPREQDCPSLEPVETAQLVPCTASKQRWPYGYAWFILSRGNPLRKASRWLLEKEVVIRDSRINVFDNFILLCICVSSICMMLDSPLRHMRHPDHGDKAIVVMADKIFAFIFIGEMALKLLAYPLIWGQDAYLKSGWNWLDAIVVCVSIIDMLVPGSSKILKTLRIMRAFRPLRIVSRNENLKIVVQTMFGAMPDLVTLIVVSMLFLLIFALFALENLKGRFYYCEPGDATLRLLGDLGTNWVTPLCLGSNATTGACPHGDVSVNPSDYSSAWINQALACPSSHQLCGGAQTFPWLRATADTPICIGRCNPEAQGENASFWSAREWLCQPAFASAAELPSECPHRDSSDYLARFSAPELDAMTRGAAYVEKMQRHLVLPCAGSTVVSGSVETPPGASAVSCRQAFCGDEAWIPQEKRDSCKSRCGRHPHFCHESCIKSGDSGSAACRSCRLECEAACQCEDFCEPLIKDAAACSEQGGQWVQRLSQNFDNVGSAFLTLFEIMSTEGWVDVMYAATDVTDFYREPVRDNQVMPFAWFFVVYIAFSFMFLLNLSVGVITDRYMDLKQAGQETTLTDAQKRWIKSNLNLFKRPLLFNVTNLHLLPEFRRRVYNFISSRTSEQGIMGCIVLNTLFLALKVFPEGLKYQGILEGLNVGLAFVFFFEFTAKLYAYRANYWKDVWNRFDFFCVVATFVGLIVRLAGFPFGTVTGVARSFRIARLFRFSSGLNKIFTALILSIPKLSNVFLVFMLFLVLFSILGVNLFAPMKLSETFNVHGNFRDFPQAFITLYRASTGEAWNEIMHDLAKSPEDYFREGTWCTPSDLWDTSDWETYQKLDARCLIDNPNSCPTYNWFPVAYFIMYTLLISYLVMNLLVAVILDGYEDGKPSHESEVIDMSIDLWRQFDPDQTLYASADDAMAFISEAVCRGEQWQRSEEPDNPMSPTEWLTSDAGVMRVKHLRAFQNMTMSVNGKVHFLVALQQVLRLVCAKHDIMKFVDIEDRIGQEVVPADIKKQLRQLKTLELKKKRPLSASEITIQQHFAILRIQKHVKEKILLRSSRDDTLAESSEVNFAPDGDSKSARQTTRPETG